MLPDLDRSITMASGHLCDLAWYIRKNESGVINYGRWRREGRRISTSAVEGTVNRLIGRRLRKGTAHVLDKARRSSALTGAMRGAQRRTARSFSALVPGGGDPSGQAAMVLATPLFLTVPADKC
jgi:hypothetical protein